MRRTWLVAVVVLSACGVAPGDVDASVNPRDGGLVDSGTNDAGSPSDAGSSQLDAGSQFDGGSPSDAGAPADAGSPVDGGPSVDAGGPADSGIDPNDDGGCQVTICLTGATERGGSNTPFDEICDQPEVPGVVQSCSGSTCFNTFNTFLVNTQSTLYPPLFHALDTNNDNQINDSDAKCGVNILGFSWGGYAGVELAGLIANDGRIAANRRRVKRLFVMDPYQPTKKITVPTNVDRFVEYRHSVVPSGADCSKSAPLGPYKGLQPHCATGQNCIDYDYSLGGTNLFPTIHGGAYEGQDVGHCAVPEVAAPAILADFRGEAFSPLPPTVTVPTP